MTTKEQHLTNLEALETRRAELGISRAELASRCQLSVHTINHYYKRPQPKNYLGDRALKVIITMLEG